MVLILQTCLRYATPFDVLAHIVSWSLPVWVSVYIFLWIWHLKIKTTGALISICGLILLCIISKDLLQVDWPLEGSCDLGTGWLIVARYSMPSTHSALSTFLVLLLLGQYDQENKSRVVVEDAEMGNAQIEALLANHPLTPQPRTRFQLVVRGLCALVYAVLLPWSRVHLQICTPADVIVGVVFGVVVFLLAHAYLSVVSIRQLGEKNE